MQPTPQIPFRIILFSLTGRKLLGEIRRSGYGHRPVLLETLVDTQRFRGTCYRAANWIHIGQTTGRGRMDRAHENHDRAIKDIYVYPLVRDARQRLCTDLTR